MQANGLTHLHISHYALIDQLDIDWGEGFSAITGETGAGKSIILGALGLLLGSRADAKAIQAGEKKCCVEGTFCISGMPLEQVFADADIDYDADECILRREVTAAGKSRAFVNDTPVTAATLKEIAARLIDIHSQHQNLLIKGEHFLIDTLDIMASRPDLPADYRHLFELRHQAIALLTDMEESKKLAEANREYMEFQLAQIDEAHLAADELTELENEQRLLSHAEDIRQGLCAAHNLLCGEEVNAVGSLRQAADSLSAVAAHYTAADELAARLQAVHIEVDDICSELERGINSIDVDPRRLSYVDERLSTIYDLERKHNMSSVAELLDMADDLRRRLSNIENADADIARQRTEVERLNAMLAEAAKCLTASRRKAALEMQHELTASLQELGMPHAVVEVRITPRTEPAPSGADNVQFLFSANKNVPPHDISQTASGGEIARVMLSIKAIIARRTHLPTIIFDEIDTGVSGRLAEKMAGLMKQIAAHCRVICITHLPQIAACAAHHYRVFKDDTGDTTLSHIVRLNAEQRVTEIAHMLSGEQLTEAAIGNARALLAK